MEKTREIKFRAWHTELKQMFSAEEMSSDQLALLPDGRFCNVHGSDTSKSTFPPMIPLQFTGLKDNNGKEIYEGDILYDGKGGNGVVEYRQPQFVVWADGEHFALAEGKINMVQLEYSEVIGNIYENPELLK